MRRPTIVTACVYIRCREHRATLACRVRLIARFLENFLANCQRLIRSTLIGNGIRRMWIYKNRVSFFGICICRPRFISTKIDLLEHFLPDKLCSVSYNGSFVRFVGHNSLYRNTHKFSNRINVSLILDQSFQLVIIIVTSRPFLE